MKFQAAAIAAFAAYATIAASFAAAAPAEARPGWAGPGNARAIAIVDRRIRNQTRRIRRARRQGRLNWVEARRVRFELSHIRGFRRYYLRDRRLSFRERRHLRRLLDRNSRRIQRLANNRGIGRPRQRLSRYNGF
jgi:hypothetical protein